MLIEISDKELERKVEKNPEQFKVIEGSTMIYLVNEGDGERISLAWIKDDEERLRVAHCLAEMMNVGSSLKPLVYKEENKDYIYLVVERDQQLKVGSNILTFNLEPNNHYYVDMSKEEIEKELETKGALKLYNDWLDYIGSDTIAEECDGVYILEVVEKQGCVAKAKIQKLEVTTAKEKEQKKKIKIKLHYKNGEKIKFEIKIKENEKEELVKQLQKLIKNKETVFSFNEKTYIFKEKGLVFIEVK